MAAVQLEVRCPGEASRMGASMICSTHLTAGGEIPIAEGEEEGEEDTKRPFGPIQAIQQQVRAPDLLPGQSCSFGP